ncbi:MAG: transglutaminase family protein [Rikenellaceae bacterium]
MARYRYSYQTIERYDATVSNYQFLIRCTPREYPFQKIEQQQLHLLTGVAFRRSRDNFGNIIHYGLMRESHDIFVVASSGVISLGEYEIYDSEPEAMYKMPTRLTHSDNNITWFAAQCLAKKTELETALDLANMIYEKMTYTPGVTNVNTTAVEAFELCGGVCQDYSHLLVSMCRLKGIYSRYVVGYVEGEGETHSWVEVHSDGKWYGIDPTHNTLILTGYIKVAHGRDAADCSVVRGIRRGVSTILESQVRVKVEQIK